MGKFLVGIGNGCVVEISADNNRMACVVVYESANTVGLSTSISCGFTQLAQKHSRTVFDGLTTRFYDGVGIIVLFCWA